MLTHTVTRTLTGSPRCCQEAHSCDPVTFDIALIRWCRRHQDSGKSYWKCTMHNSTAILDPDAHLMAPRSVCLERRGYVKSAFSWQFWPRHSEIDVLCLLSVPSYMAHGDLLLWSIWRSVGLEECVTKRRLYFVASCFISDLCLWSRESADSIATKLRTGRCRVRTPREVKETSLFQKVHICSEVQPEPIQFVPGVLHVS
jgi:hypothetical protein